MKKMHVVTLVSFAFFLPVAAMSAGFPDKPIQLVVPYKPGGGSDVSARIFAQCLERTSLHQRVIVKNIAGARGKTGEMEVKSARPDGYTLLWQHQSLHIAKVTGRSEYSYKDFKPIALTAVADGGLFVAKNLGIKNAKELVEKLKADPGSFTIGAAVNGVSHFGVLAFIDSIGVPVKDLRVVGISGDKNRIIAMMQGNIKLTSLPDSAAKPYVESGDLIGIGIQSDERDPSLPKVPTLKEQGYESRSVRTDYETWAPKGLPQDIENVLADAWIKAAADPKCQEKMAANAVRLVSYQGEKLDNYNQKSFEVYRHLAEKYNMGESK